MVSRTTWEKRSDYLLRGRETRARNFGQEIRDKTRQLALHPELGRAGRPGLPADARELVAHPNYVVFYRVLAETRTVQILRVKHAAQQVPVRWAERVCDDLAHGNLSLDRLGDFPQGLSADRWRVEVPERNDYSKDSLLCDSLIFPCLPSSPPRTN